MPYHDEKPRKMSMPENVDLSDNAEARSVQTSSNDLVPSQKLISASEFETPSRASPTNS